MRHPAEEREVADTDVARDRNFLIFVDGERDQAVDITGLQPGVIDGGLDRLAGQLQLATTRVLGVLGLTDPCNGGDTAERTTHPPTPSSTLSTAVPITWSPRLLEP